MIKHNFSDFFEELKKFKLKQKKQKERGLNDYNLLTTVLSESDEVRLHSRVIGSLLDINGLHYQRELFLEKFFEILKVTNFEYDLNNSKVILEYQHIDLYLTDGIKHIIIENKINAGYHSNQIKRYIETIRKENYDIEFTDILVIYLSNYKPEALKNSLGDLIIKQNILYENNEEIAIFKNILYEKEILDWLDSCLFEIQNITNLNESIQQYKIVVEKITNKYKEKIMPMKDFILEKDNLKLAVELEKSVKDAKSEIQLKFWIDLKEQLKNRGLGFKFTDYEANSIKIVDKTKEYYKNNKRFYGLTKKINDIDDEHSLIFYIEVDWNIIYGVTVTKNKKRRDICNEEKFKKKTKEIIDSNDTINWNTQTKWWICWKYPNKRLNFYNFKSDIIFDLNNDERRKDIVGKFVDEIMTNYNEILKVLNNDTI